MWFRRWLPWPPPDRDADADAARLLEQLYYDGGKIRWLRLAPAPDRPDDDRQIDDRRI